MPHLLIQYSGNLDGQADMTALCRNLADTLVAQRGDDGAPVFPPGATRVLAYPAQHFAVADNERDYAFAYLNLRMKKGRSEATQQRIGAALLATAKATFDPIQTRRLVGVTVQIDVSSEVYEGRVNNIDPLFENGG
jgi:5-carboxymethyl-2-hydroxymuconate isomerase